MRKKHALTLIASCFMFLVACQNAPDSAPVPTATILPTNASVCTEVPGEDTPEPTPTIAPTNTVAPTNEPTKEPTEAPVPTEEPTPTNTPTPTIEPTTTPIPSPTPIAGLVVIPTSTPTPLPTELPTPTPTPYVVIDSGLALKFQAGDAVWYHVYEDGTLVVSGTGSTWDFEVNEVVYKFIEIDIDYDYFAIHTIAIEEGITRIGNWALSCFYGVTKVIIPNSLKEVGENGFDGVGWDVGYSEWINLDFNKLKTTSTSFCDAKGLDSIEGSEEAMATPTPTPVPPTPTPTPLPDPNNPRKIGEQKVTKTVNLEYWDDGTIKILGTGEANDNKLGDIGPWPHQYLKYDLGLTSDYFNKLVISEGITGLKYVFSGFDFNEIYLSKKFDWDNAKEYIIIVDAEDKIYCYYNGKPLTVTFSEHPTAEVTGSTSLEELAKNLEEMITNNKAVSEPSELFIGYQDLTHGDPIIHLSWE